MSYNQQYLVAAQMGHQQVQVQQHAVAEIAHQQAVTAQLELAAAQDRASAAQLQTVQLASASAAQLELAAGQPANTNALAIRRPFDPRAHDLDAHFRLTRFADLKG